MNLGRFSIDCHYLSRVVVPAKLHHTSINALWSLAGTITLDRECETCRQQVRRCFDHVIENGNDGHVIENGNDGHVILGLFFKR
jgi:hypothetical protein